MLLKRHISRSLFLSRSYVDDERQFGKGKEKKERHVSSRIQMRECEKGEEKSKRIRRKNSWKEEKGKKKENKKEKKVAKRRKKSKGERKGGSKQTNKQTKKKNGVSINVGFFHNADCSAISSENKKAKEKGHYIYIYIYKVKLAT